MQTIPSQALFVDEQDVRAQGSRDACSSQPPRTTADDDQVVEIVCHVCSSEEKHFLPSIPTSSIALKGRDFCSLGYIRMSERLRSNRYAPLLRTFLLRFQLASVRLIAFHIVLEFLERPPTDPAHLEHQKRSQEQAREESHV